MSNCYTHVATIDFETYYDKDYGLRKQHMTDYIRDARFEAQSCAIKLDDGPTRSYRGAEAIRQALCAIDWSHTAFLGHHVQFDGLIATHHFGIYPCFWLDTLSIARSVIGVDVSVSLKALCERLGRPGKVHAQALVDVKGIRLAEMSVEQSDALAEYNRDDVEDTAWLFGKLSPLIPDAELRLIDMTVRMYTEPVLALDGARVEQAYQAELERKQAIYAAAGVDVKALGSAEQFAAALRTLHVEPPTKISLRTGKQAYAFAKQDLAFKQLLEHPDERVRLLVEARLASKSTLVETRARTIAGREGYPTPVYLTYWGARTGRWSGGDGANYQNLPKKGIGAELRRSIIAPAGCRLVVSDASQIEARTLAWNAHQQDVLDTFAANEDVYAMDATNMYGRRINKHDNPNERQVGKTFRLGAGYGAGPAKINYMMKIGSIGPVIKQPLSETEQLVAAWRAANAYIVQHWKQSMRNATTAFLNLQTVEDGVICYEGTKRGGYIHLPNKTWVFYPHVFWDDDTSASCLGKAGMAYVSRNGKVRFWHGLIVENITQALARAILGEQMLRMQDAMPDMRIATTTHDEVLAVVPVAKADAYAQTIHDIMSIPPTWAKGLPLNADTHVWDFYNKT